MAADRTQAAVVTGPRTAELTTVELPALGAGRVRVQVEGSGLCGSNVPVWEGRPWFSYPLAPGAPGHEAWGRVVEQGEGAGQVDIGTRVAVLADNALVELLDVPVTNVVPLPDELAGPFPGEALGCAFNVAARCGFAPGQTVAVVGAGFLGTLVVALAAEAGATVVAVGRRQAALDVARSFGAKETVRLDQGDPVAAVAELTGGELCDVVVEAVGAQQPLDVAGQLTKVRGRLVVAGFHQDGERRVDLQLWNWRGIDVVNAHERDDQVRLAGIRAAVEAVVTGRLDPRPLYSHRLPMGQVAEAMEALVDRPAGFMKALVTW